MKSPGEVPQSRAPGTVLGAKQMAPWTCEMSLHHSHTLYKSLRFIGDLASIVQRIHCNHHPEKCTNSSSKEVLRALHETKQWFQENNHQKHNWKQWDTIFHRSGGRGATVLRKVPDPFLWRLGSMELPEGTCQELSTLLQVHPARPSNSNSRDLS